MHVLVTGATGFIGQHLLRHCGDRGIKTSAVTRNKSAFLPKTSQRVICDFTDRASFSALPKEIDAVVHLGDGLAAALETVSAPLSDCKLLEHVKVTQQFAQWAAQNPRLKCFIYISSLKAMCGEAEATVLDEASPVKPTSNYGRAKRLAELSLQQIFQNMDARLAIVRNPIVHGPGCQSNMARLLKLAQTPWPLPFEGLRCNHRSTLGVDNLCNAIIALLKSDVRTLEQSSTFLVSDDEALTLAEMITCFRQALDMTPKLFSLPSVGWRVAAHVPKVGPLITRLTQPLVISNAKFKATVSWQPSITTQASLREMTEYYVANNYSI